MLPTPKDQLLRLTSNSFVENQRAQEERRQWLADVGKGFAGRHFIQLGY